MPTIDEKVVQMQFDNKQFEKGVAESLNSLEKLKKSLQLSDSSDGLESLQKSMNRFDISGLTKNIDSIASHFTVVGRFIDRHIDQMIDKMTNGVKNFVKGISVDQISSGMNKYEQYNQSVQMIRSALPQKSIEEIEAVLGKLNEYTDLTSYSFTEMANSIGKFTSAGVDLETSEIAMEGIANWAASAGGNVREANIAMYNLSQALSSGAVKVMDWKSIELANMATKQFKEQAIDAAIELGVLQKTGDHVGVMFKQTKSGVEANTVTFENFRQTLADGWFNADVLLKVLSKYADRESDVGKSAFAMAKVAITWTQAVDAIKDAISTGWMNTFRYLIGDLDEAGVLFTRISDAIIGFAENIYTARNEVLEAWHVQGGYNSAIEAAANIWHIFLDVVEMVRQALSVIFPPVTAERLVDLTKKVEDFTSKLRGVFDMVVGETGGENPIEKMFPTMQLREFFGELKMGMKGDEVKYLQKRLEALGISLDKYGADGIFGSATERAIKEFQKQVGIKPTGVFDETTWKALQENIASTGWELERSLYSYPKDKEVFSRSLSLGDIGDDVEMLQWRLIDLGYITEDNTVKMGEFDETTRNALKAFQEDMKLEENNIGYKAEGVYDNTTWKALSDVLYPVKEQLKETADQAEKLAEVDTPTQLLGTYKELLKIGSKGESVRKLQKALIRTGYLSKDFAEQSKEDALGVYGPETAKAVREFQKKNKLDDDGIFGQKTYDKLIKKMFPAKKGLEDIAKTEQKIEKMAPFTNLLKVGDKNEDVLALQKQLVSLGYLADESMANGVFGKETKKALIKLQNDLVKTGKLSEDSITKGTYGYYTWEAMNNLVDEHNASLEKTPQKVDAVAKAQENLSNILGGFFSIIKNVLVIGAQGIRTVIEAGKMIFNTFSPLIGVALDFLGLLGGIISKWDVTLGSGVVFATLLGTLEAILKPVSEWVQNLANNIGDFIEKNKNVKSLVELWENFKKAISENKALTSIIGIFETLIIAVKNTVPPIKEFYGNIRKYLWSGLQKAFGWIGENVPKILEIVSNGLSKIIDWAAKNQVLTKAFNGLLFVLKIIGGVVGGVAFGLFALFDAIKNGVVYVFNLAKNSETLKNAFEGLKTFFKPITNFFTAIGNTIDNLRKSGKRLTFNSVLEAFVTEATKAGNLDLADKALTLSNNLYDLGDRIKIVGGNVKTWIIDKFGPAITLFGSIGTAIKNVLYSGKKFTLKNLYEELLKVLAGSKSLNKLKLANKIKMIAKKITGLVKSIKTLGASIKEWVLDKFGIIKDWTTKNFGKIISSVKNFFGGIYDKIKAPDNVTNPIDRIRIALTNLWTMVRTTAGSFLSKIKEFFSFDKDLSFIYNIKQKLGILKDFFSNFGTKIIDKIKEIYANSPLLQKAFAKIRSVIGPIVEKIKTLVKEIQKLASGDFSSITDLFGSLWDKVKTLFSGGDEKGDKQGKKFGLIDRIKEFFSKFKGLNITKLIAPALGAIGLYSLFKMGDAIRNFALGFRFKTTGETDSDAIKKISEAVLLITVSIAALTYIVDKHGEQAWAGVAMIATMITSLMGIMLLFNKLGGKDAKGASKQIMRISAAILLMALGIGAMTLIIDKYSIDTVLKAMAVIGGMFLGLLALMGIYQIVTSKFGGGSTSVPKGMLEMCAGVAVLVVAVAGMVLLLKIVKDEGLIWRAIGMIGAMVAGLGIVAGLMARIGGKGKAKIGPILALVAGVMLLVVSVAAMTLMVAVFGDKVYWAFGIIEALLVSLGLLSALIVRSSTSFTKALGGILTIIVLAGAIGLLAICFGDVLLKIKDVDPWVIIGFLGGMSVLLLSAAGVVKILSSINPKALAIAEVALLGLGVVLGLVAEIMSAAFMDAADNVGTGLFLFGNSFETFGECLNKVNWEGVTAACDCIKDVVLPLMKELIIMSSDSGKLDTFGTALFSLGTNISLFDVMISSVNIEFVKSVCDCMTNDILPLTAKISELGESADAIDAGGNALTNMGADFESYSTTVSNIDTENLVDVTAIADNAAAAAATIRSIGEAGDITKILTDMSGAIGIYIDTLKGMIGQEGGNVNTEDLPDLSPDFINKAFGAMAQIQIDDGMLERFRGYADGDSSGLNDFAIGIQNIGTALRSYGEHIGTIDKGNAEDANDILNTISGIQDRIDNFTDGDITKSSIYGQSTKLGVFSRDIIKLGAALESYGDHIGGLNFLDIVKANYVLGYIETIKENISHERMNGFLENSGILGKKQDLTEFGKDIAALGGALQSYGESIGGLDDDKIKIANNALSIVATIATSLPNTGGIGSWLTGEQDLGKFASNMNSLGTGVANYGNAISGASFTGVESSLKVIKTVANILQTVEKTGGMQSWFTGNKNIGTLGSGLDTLGTKIASFQTNVGTIDKAKIDDAMDVIQSIIEKHNQIQWQDKVGASPFSDIVDDYIGGLENLVKASYGNIVLKKGGWGSKEVSVSMSEGLKNLGAVIPTNIADGIKENTKLPKDEVDTLISDLKSKFDDPEFSFTTKGETLMTDLSTGIKDNALTATKENDAVITTMSDKIQALVSSSSEYGKSIVMKLGDGIRNYSRTPINQFSSLISNLRTSIQNFIRDCISLGEQISDKIGSGISNHSYNAKNPITTILVDSYTKIRSYSTTFETGGYWLVYGLSKGIYDHSNTVFDAVTWLGKEAWNRFCQEMQINSPSKKFIWAGEMSDRGYAVGLKKYASLVGSASKEVANTAISNVQEGLKTVGSSTFDDNFVPVITPVLDMSEVESGMSRIGDMTGKTSYALGVKSLSLANSIKNGQTNQNGSNGAKDRDTNEGLASSINNLNTRVNELGEAITNMKVVTETGALVGQIITDVDRKLGRKKLGLGGWR